MREQMLYRHLRLGIEDFRLIFAVNLHVFEGGNEFGDRRVQLEMPFFVKHHHGDAGDRLRHGVDAEDSIKFHRFRCGDVAQAEFFKMDEFPFAGNHG